MSDVLYISRRFLRDTLAPALAADGWTYLHCPEWHGCGEFAVVRDGVRWTCPEHGAEGVAT